MPCYRRCAPTPACQPCKRQCVAPCIPCRRPCAPCGTYNNPNPPPPPPVTNPNPPITNPIPPVTNPNPPPPPPVTNPIPPVTTNPEEPKETDILSLTPNYTRSETVGVKCIESHTKSHEKHDPDSIQGVPPWPTWDGTTTIDQYSTPGQLAAHIWPNGNFQMRGLRELFYKVKPFADISKPTVSEIENWNVEVIMQMRRLVGRGNYTLTKDPNIFLNSHWASERKYTTVWDQEYPLDTTIKDNALGKAWGPCWDPPGSNVPVDKAAGHCGGQFVPSPMDQQAYFESPTQGTVSPNPGSEGTFNMDKNLNWSVKLSAIMQAVVKQEGNTGHGGPMFRRSKMGFSCICDKDPATIRFLWGGEVYKP